MTEVKLNRPAWLGSAVGLVLKTKTVNSTTAAATVTETDVNGNSHTIVKSGTLFHDSATSEYGLIYNDVDITGGAKPASVMFGGYYIDANLPATVASYVSNFAATGLFPLVEGSVTRPNFGTNGLTKLTIGTVTNTSGTLSWSKVAGAIGYKIYVGTTLEETIAQADSPSYEIGSTTAGTYSYTVVAVGDNITYSDSNASTAVSVVVS